MMADGALLPTLARVTQVTRELADVFTLHLDTSPWPDGFVFAPGQFNMLYQLGAGEVAISISGDPAHPRSLVHTIRAVGSVTRVMRGLRRGDTVGVRGPYGTAWPLEAAGGKDLVIISGGLGLAPLRPAILRVLADRGSYRRVLILYGARSPDDILFRKDLEMWRSHLDTSVEVTVDRADTSYFGHVGVVTSLLAGARFDPKDAVVLMCGPEIMMRFTVHELEHRGVPHEAMYVSMERNMKCGVGLCGHCQYGPSFVCKDGPVFRFDRVAGIFYVREI